nr:serine/threonine protein kinase [Streptomyces sp. NBC_00899]
MDPLLPGDPARIGPYRATHRLGAGGMGQVFLATDAGGERAAVKVIRPEYARDPGFRRRFAREVAAARRVSGARTARVIGADTDAAEPWLATEYVPGLSLQDHVTQRGTLEPAAVLTLACGLAEGLAAIHTCRLAHRDVKPGNVILAADGPRIIDFGIAQAQGASTLTTAGVVVGTYAYMAPEQVHGEAAGPESDVFALGAVLTFAATGRSPFEAPSVLAIARRIADDEPRLDGVPGALRRLIEQCLRKAPNERPTAAEVLSRARSALAAAASAVSAPPKNASPAPAPPAKGPAYTPTVKALPPRTGPPGRRNARLKTWGVLAVLAVGALGGVLDYLDHRTTGPHTAALPKSYVGTWQGDPKNDPGADQVTVRIAAGHVGDRLGTLNAVLDHDTDPVYCAFTLKATSYVGDVVDFTTTSLSPSPATCASVTTLSLQLMPNQHQLLYSTNEQETWPYFVNKE